MSCKAPNVSITLEPPRLVQKHNEIDAIAPYSYAIARYGKLCHEFYRDDAPGINELSNNFSATKTLSATLFGRAVLMSQELPNPLSNTDRMDDWVTGRLGD